VSTESTPSAVAAPPASVDGDWLADLQTGDVGAEGGDPPGVLVPQGERWIPRQLAGLEVVHQEIHRLDDVERTEYLVAWELALGTAVTAPAASVTTVRQRAAVKCSRAAPAGITP
jgi:hypothetical protein